jgi:hypothetical protein
MNQRLSICPSPFQKNEGVDGMAILRERGKEQSVQALSLEWEDINPRRKF